jgi:AcrR family transcriptional regulator
MTQRVINRHYSDSETKNEILNAATELFAFRGYSAVSMKDVASKVGIKPASIYHYYEGKDALMADIVTRFEKGYRNYFAWLRNMNKAAKSLDKVMDNMFNDEMFKMLDPIGCFGIALMLRNQHNLESARKCVFELLYKESIHFLQADFDRLVEKRIIPPSDTKTLATVFMSCVLVGNEMRMYEYKGEKAPLHSSELFSSLKKLLTVTLTRGF